LFVWRWPDQWTFGALLGLGCLGTIAHISVARALAAADASACAPFEFARLPFAALIGFLCFGEVTDLWTWVGAAIIAGSSFYGAHREARIARLARRREPRAPALSRRSSYGRIARGE
jgi:drug/metabolite transporter (DMT)-like permease